MNRLDVKNLSISVKGHRLVQGIDFSSKENETLAILGESGSGKTLTALSVMGLLDRRYQVQGEILFDGVDLNQLPETKRKAYALRRIAMIYQNPFRAFSPVEKIQKQVKRIYEIQKEKEDMGKVRELLGYSHLEPKYILEKYPFEMSGGELQRTLIALSMLFEPELLICDEPTTALDVKTGEQVLTMIKTLQEAKGLSVLFISHDLTSVEKIAHRIVVMKEGKIVESGTKEELLTNPKEDYTKLLMEASRLERC